MSLSNISPYVLQTLFAHLSPADVSVRQTCTVCRKEYDFTMAEYQKRLEDNVVLSLWKANVYSRNGNKLPEEAYVLPKTSDATDTQRMQVLQAALETARHAWSRFSKADRSKFDQVTPEFCCRDPELFNAILRILDEIALVDMLKGEIPEHENESRDLQMQALMELTDLDLATSGLQTLPDSFGNLTGLNRLDLTGNKLQTLPDSFGNLPELTNLCLGNNNLHALPKQIVKLANLSFLILQGNKLQVFPDLLVKLTKMNNLDLSNNNLRGLPESIDNLTELTRLYLDTNDLETLPESLCNLNALEYLDVRGNKALALDERSCKTLAALRQKPGCTVLCDEEVEREIEGILNKQQQS